MRDVKCVSAISLCPPSLCVCCDMRNHEQQVRTKWRVVVVVVVVKLQAAMAGGGGVAVVVQPAHAPGAQHFNVSRFNQSAQHAIPDAARPHNRLHRVYVPFSGVYTLSVFLHALLPSSSFMVGWRRHYSVSIRLISGRPVKQHQILRSSICPVMLPQHAPTTTISRERIVGGDMANNGFAPYMARIERNGLPKCSGALIAPQVVLTAAHCVYDARHDIRTISVYVGGSRLGENPGTLVYVSEIIVHPRYKFVHDNDRFPLFDIAYLRLTRAPNNNSSSSSTSAMRVNTNASVPAVGSVVRVAGYGVLGPAAIDAHPSWRRRRRRGRGRRLHAPMTHAYRHEDRQDNDESAGISNAQLQLYQVDVPVVSGEDCLNSYKSSSIQVNDSRNICAGYLGVGKCDSW